MIQARNNWPEVSEMPALSDHQRVQIQPILESRIGILCGSPGTGKTFVTAEIIRALSNAGKLGQVVVAAPSGKAATRVTECLNEAGIPLQARTIHSTLRATRGGDSWQFEHNEDYPLDASYILIDEASMIDVKLMASILAAVAKGARILFIGDPYQLPPVGGGAPLRDIIKSHAVPIAMLTEIRRNSGDIVKGCHAIKSRKDFPAPKQKISLAEGHNWMHRECGSHQQQAVVEQLLTNVPSHIDRVLETQVIVATNEKGNANRKDMNLAIRDIVNPANSEDFDAADARWRIRDKVIFGRNTSFNSATVNPETLKWSRQPFKVPVVNGSLGQVVAVQKHAIAVRLHDQNACVEVPKANFNQIELAYAMTCHKSQGSQFKIVIALIDDSGSAAQVTGCEWWYTALSRAQTLLVTVGRWRTLMQQAKPVKLQVRKTLLEQRLKSIRV